MTSESRGPDVKPPVDLSQEAVAQPDGRNGVSLADHTLGGLMWMFSGSSVLLILRTLVMVILARLLTPEDYGLVGAAMIIVNFAQLFSQLGIGPALIQRPILEDRHLRTAFTVFTLAGLVVGAVIALGAPLIAGFFKRDDLIPIMWVAALAFPLQGMAAIPSSLLTRNLQFRKLAGISVATYFVGYGVVGVGLALLGMGAWALVAANLAQFVTNVAILLVVQPFPKKPQFERSAMGELLYFGGGFTAARFLGYVAEQGDFAVVGRWLGASALGIYNRAYNLLVLPATYFSNVLDQVLFPALAKVQDDQERLRLGYRYGMVTVAIIVLPVSVVAILLAPELVAVVLGPRWVDVVVPFRILAVGMLFRTAAKINSSVARATGAIYRRAWREGVYAACVVGGALVGQRWGIAGVSVAVLASLTIHFALMTQFSMSLVSMQLRMLVAAHVPGLALACIVAALVAPATAVLRGQDIPSIAVLAVTLTLVALAMLVILWKRPRRLLGQEGVEILSLLQAFASGKWRKLQRLSRQRKAPVLHAEGER